ncbi:toll/interleukin-1 receptor domain-containing protein [Guggenheimella bovis]
MAEELHLDPESNDLGSKIVLNPDETKEPKKSYKYQAFISYRHVEPDATIASKIHTLIETFPIPKTHYEDGKKPTYRVFRDREELTSTELSTSIDAALRESKFLVVICSKRTPLSPWCVKEIETFIRLHGPDRIIPVLVEGEPQESFPAPLLDLKKTITNEAGDSVDVQMELLAAELRPAEVQSPDFVGYETLDRENSEKRKTLLQDSLKLLKTTEIYRIMAAMLGVSYGDLKEREKERRTKRMLRLTGVVAAALLVFGIFMFNAYRQANIARLEAQESNAAMLLNEAAKLTKEGDATKAVLVSEKAMKMASKEMPLYDEINARYENILSQNLIHSGFHYTSSITTRNTLGYASIDPKEEYVATGLGASSVGIYKTSNGELVKTLDGFKGQVKQTDFSSDGKYLVAGAFDKQVKVWDTKDYKEVKTFTTDDIVIMSRFTKDAKELHILSLKDKKILLSTISTTDWKETSQTLLPGNLKNFIVLPESDEIIILTSNGLEEDTRLKIIKKGSGAPVFDFPIPKEDVGDVYSPYFTSCRVNSDFTKLYATGTNALYCFDLKTKEILFKEPMNRSNDDNMLAVSSDGKYVYMNDNSSLVVFDGNTGKILRSLFPGETINEMMMAEDGTVGLLLKSGDLTLLKDLKIIGWRVPYGKAEASYLTLGRTGKYAIVGSLKDGIIKIGSTSSINAFEDIDAQLVSVSKNNRFALFYKKEGSFVWDLEKKGVHLELPKANRQEFDSRVYLNKDFGLSNDGNLVITGNAYETRNEKGDLVKYKQQVEVIRLKDLKTVYYTPFSGSTAYFGFTSNPDLLYLRTTDGYNRLIDWKKDKVVQVIPSKTDVFQNLMFSDDMKFYVENFQSGNYRITRVDTETVVHEGTGEVFYVGNDEKGILEAKGILVDKGFTWKLGDEEETYHTLSSARSELGNSPDNLNEYDKESGLLLTIKKEGFNNSRKAVLINFETGELVKEFSLDTGASTVQCHIARGGKELLLFSEDPYFNDFTVPSESEYLQESLVIGRTMHLKLLSREELEEEAKKFTGNRKLSEDELSELSLKK